jgi:hypothetical protein
MILNDLAKVERNSTFATRTFLTLRSEQTNLVYYVAVVRGYPATVQPTTLAILGVNLAPICADRTDLAGYTGS